MTLEVCRKDFEALIRRIQLFGQSDLGTKYVTIVSLRRIVSTCIMVAVFSTFVVHFSELALS